MRYKFKTTPSRMLHKGHPMKDVVIDFVPMLKRNVGIGWKTEREAVYSDFAAYPVIERPWLDLKKYRP